MWMLMHSLIHSNTVEVWTLMSFTELVCVPELAEQVDLCNLSTLFCITTFMGPVSAQFRCSTTKVAQLK